MAQPMQRHWSERAWWWATSALVVLGVCVSPVLDTPGTMLPLCLSVAVFAVAVSAVADTAAGGRVRHAARSGLLAGVVAMALSAYLAVLAQLALLLVAVLALTSPPAQRWWRRRGLRREEAARPGTRTLAAVGDPPAVETTEPDMPATLTVSELSTPQILAAWRHSFWDLKSSSSWRVRAEVVAIRQECLDELERRHPEALRAWLETDPRAVENPTRFFRPPDPPRAAV